MLSHTIRASRQGIALLARQHAASAQRGFATTAQRKADIVQDIYLRELKNYKVPSVKSNDHEGQVKPFKAPETPKSPEEGDLANDLKSYESQQPDIQGQSSKEDTSSAPQNFFEDFEDPYDPFDPKADEKEEAHH